jgi:hypothetical protein
MGRHGEFGCLRSRLDEAITYGTKTEAVRLANKALKKAKQENIFAENILKARSRSWRKTSSRR